MKHLFSTFMPLGLAAICLCSCGKNVEPAPEFAQFSQPAPELSNEDKSKIGRSTAKYWDAFRQILRKEKTELDKCQPKTPLEFAKSLPLYRQSASRIITTARKLPRENVAPEVIQICDQMLDLLEKTTGELEKVETVLNEAIKQSVNLDQWSAWKDYLPEFELPKSKEKEPKSTSSKLETRFV